ncbi:hypothetical protein FS837_004639 [Tulasnella sp. UAMH 9824]|nr:hypothetical protein FS837_004639 [Tulasnella sp. UAMH 9824]
MSRPPAPTAIPPSPAYPRFYDSEHEWQRIREVRNQPRAVLRKQSHHKSPSSRPRDLQLVEDQPSNPVLAFVDRFVAPPTSPTLKPSPPIGGRDGTLHVQVDDSTYRIRNIRPDGARTHVRRPSAQEVQDRLRQLPSSNASANLPRRSNSFNRSSNNHLPPSPATPIAPARRHQPGTADLHLRLNVQDVNPVWDGSQDWVMVGRDGAPGPRPPLPRAPPPRPPRPNNVNLFDDEPPKRPPALSFSSSTSSGQSSRNASPQTPTSPASPSGWTSYYTDRGNEAKDQQQQQQQVEPPLPPLPAPMTRSPPASMGFGRRAKSPPAFSTRPINPSVMVNLTGGTTASGSLTSIGNLMTSTSPIPERESMIELGLEDDSSLFSDKPPNAREEERGREREQRRSGATRREKSQAPPATESNSEEGERQNAFSRLRDFTRARSKSLGRESSRRRRTPSPPSRPPPLPTSPLVATPNSARTIKAPSSPRPLYHMDFLAPHEGRDSPSNNGPQSRPHSIAVSESSVITAGGTRYNIRNKALRVVNAAPSTSGSSRGSIASRSSLGSTITALFSHSTSSKSSVSDKTSSSSKSSERLASLKAQALEADICRALNIPHAPYYSPSSSSRGESPLPPPSFTFQDYCSSPASETGSAFSSPHPRYAGLVDPHNRMEFDVRQTLEELSLVEEELFGKGRVRPWEKEPDLSDTDDAAMSLETLIRVDRRKRGKRPEKRPERRGPVALRIPRR